jgi:acyl-CoA dehydrogenase
MTMNGLSTLITFSEEQAMLLEVANSFCRDKSPVSKVRAQLASVEGFDRALWDEMVSLGWAGIAVPEQYGGSGLSLAEVATITEPMGRHLMATPFVSTQLLIQGVLAGGSEAQKTTVLGKICNGAIATVALFERDGDWNLSELDARAVMQGELVSLSGTKTLVCDAGVAELFLVSVALEGEPALVILTAADIPDVRRSRETIIDETRRSYRINLDGLSIPVSALIKGPAAKTALDVIRNTGLLLASAEAAGGIAGALDVIVGYLNLRTTFGRKIGSYQSLKHTSAEILIGLERSRSHVYHAASLIAAGQDAEIALRMAKVESSDSFAFAGDRGVQFHGGFGFTYECDAQLYLRRALWLQYCFGDATHHRRRLADRLLVSAA